MIAVIPVRAGSKSVPDKNVRRIAGKPLVRWVIDAALRAESVDRIVVTTDDPRIADMVGSLQETDRKTDLALHWRSAAAASDTASTESAMLEALDDVGADDTICLLQATSPLTTPQDIDAAADVFAAGGWDSLLSVVPQHRFLWRAAHDGAAPMNYDPADRPRRQEMEPLLVENGAIYLTTMRRMTETRSRLSGRIGLYHMRPSTYVELDEPDDWAVLDALLRRDAQDQLHDLARGVRILFTDVDGVLTDSGMYWSSDGSESKKFSARDGKGFELLRLAGINVVMITSESTELVARRAEKLKAEVVLGCANKLAAADAIRQRTGLSWKEVGFIGDDVHDVELMRSVGFSAAPADAAGPVLPEAAFVTSAPGGAGCFREVADLVLAAQERPPEAVS